jgi:hypothetical protein
MAVRVAKLVRDLGEEPLLVLLDLPELLGHAIEGARQVSDLVICAHAQRLAKAPVRDATGGRGELADGSSQPEGYEARGTDAGEEAPAQRHEHSGPGARLQLAHGNLLAVHLGRRHARELAEGLIELVDGLARRPLGDLHGPGGVALAYEGALAIHEVLVRGEGGDRFAVACPLRVRLEQALQAGEIDGGPRSALLEEIAIGAVTQHEVARLETQEPRHHFLEGDLELERGKGAPRDVTVGAHEVIDGLQAPRRHTHQGEDDERGGGEDLRG